MAKKQSHKQRTGVGWLTWTFLKRAMIAALLTVAIIAALIAYQTIEEFLIADKRFSLPKPEVAGDLSPGIRITGVENASTSRIRDIFMEDGGRSLYEFPARERRLRLLAVDWVRDAAVSRVWPNRVEVAIRERTPVAYVQLSRRRLVLIDTDGVLLEKPEQSEFNLPILTGIYEEQKEEMRARRVKLMMRMLADIGELESGISEIDVSEPDNLVLTQDVGSQSAILHIGRTRFRERLTNFLKHYPEIHRRQPRSTTFDLRIDDRITALDGVEANE